MLDLHIRKYEEGDLERMAQVHDSARKIELELAALSAAFVPFVLASENEGLFEYDIHVACIDGVVIGFIACSEDEIAWLYVEPAHMKKGIGRSLVTYVLENSFKDKRVSVEVLTGNEPALAFYRSCGFVEREIVSGAMPGNESFGVTVHVLAKE